MRSVAIRSRCTKSVKAHDKSERMKRGIFSTTGFHAQVCRPRRAAEAAQGPIVQQQEHQRQRDQHRLAHQPQQAKEPYQQVAGQRLALADIAPIGRQREHEEQAAQDIFALGDPGDRFHAEGMNGKDGRHQALGQRLPVRQSSVRKSRTATAAWIAALVK